MGFLRGVFKGIAGVIFIFLLAMLLMNIVLYETTKSDVLKPLFSNILGEDNFNKMYERPCQDVECLKLQDFPGFVTRSFNLFLSDLLIMTAVLTAIFALLLFLLSSGWQSKFASLGTPLILIGISAVPLEFFKSKIQAGELQFLADRIIEITVKYSLICLAAGIILIILSLIVKMSAKKVKGGKKKRKKK
jgi:hypothetical protein